MAGKSSLISAILSEKEQFKEDFEKIIYIFSYEDDNIAKLRKKFSKKRIFCKGDTFKFGRDAYPWKNHFVY